MVDRNVYHRTTITTNFLQKSLNFYDKDKPGYGQKKIFHYGETEKNVEFI